MITFLARKSQGLSADTMMTNQGGADIPAIIWDNSKSQKSEDIAEIEKTIVYIESFTGWKKQEHESTLTEHN
ncbi:hypothetical protein CDAR_259201 [Caerostris darwini]|uniref:Uncharacterized protein n=1 Tax=Caerostris darwini TaxID=1538125 RepID=A0AAV4MAS8_9ARAC|nr:hypothetical protein CDAR_259201 [Caerostris darwini]